MLVYIIHLKMIMFATVCWQKPTSPLRYSHSPSTAKNMRIWWDFRFLDNL